MSENYQLSREDFSEELYAAIDFGHRLYSDATAADIEAYAAGVLTRLDAPRARQETDLYGPDFDDIEYANDWAAACGLAEHQRDEARAQLTKTAALLRQWRAGKWSGQLNGDTDALLAELEGTP